MQSGVAWILGAGFVMAHLMALGVYTLLSGWSRRSGVWGHRDIVRDDDS